MIGLLTTSSGAILCILYGSCKWLDNVRQKLFAQDTKLELFTMTYDIKDLIRNGTPLRDIFLKIVHKHPYKIALKDADSDVSQTYKEFGLLSNKISHFFYRVKEYRKGDVVGMMMNNDYEAISTLLGLASIGVIVSIIDPSMDGDRLSHCLNTTNCKGLVFTDASLSKVIRIENDIDFFYYGNSIDLFEKCHFLQKSLEVIPNETSVKCTELLDHSDDIFITFKSQPDGLPRPQVWKIGKILHYVAYFANAGISAEDVLYQSLPLHNINGLLMTLSSFLNGARVITKKRFSAEECAKDCYQNNVTVFNYLRDNYDNIINQFKNNKDKTNSKLCLAIGSGLDFTELTELKEQSNVPTIAECVDIIESHTIHDKEWKMKESKRLFLTNLDFKLVKVDMDSGEIVRHLDGVAIEASIGEAGQACYKFNDLTSKEDKKPNGQDIFTKGDLAFVTDYILSVDNEGFYYFHQKIEKRSTIEDEEMVIIEESVELQESIPEQMQVMQDQNEEIKESTNGESHETVLRDDLENELVSITKAIHVVLYEVNVPKSNEKAVMIQMHDPDKNIDVQQLPRIFDQVLPEHRRPVFIRLTPNVNHLPHTVLKAKLRDEGFDPRLCKSGEEMYYFNKKGNRYSPLLQQHYELIKSGIVKIN